MVNDQEQSELTEITLEGKRVYDGPFFHIDRDTVRLPDGNTAQRERLRHPGAVAIVALTDDGCVIMERQFRYALGKIISEVPAGKLDSFDEDRLEAAKREFKEETGYEAESWSKIGEYIPAAGYSDEIITIFMARDLTRKSRSLDEDEFINVFQVPLSELVKEIMEGEITDGKTQTALLLTARLFGV